MTNQHGLEIIVKPQSFSIGVSSVEIQRDFLSESVTRFPLAMAKKFSDVSDWKTLKNFIAAALLQHRDPSTAESIELSCRNVFNAGYRFDVIGDWIQMWPFNSPQVPQALSEANGTVDAPMALVASNCVAFVWNYVFITVQTNKKSIDPGFELCITSHKKPHYLGQRAFSEWYQHTMDMLDSLRNANFLMFNCLLTERAKSVFGICEPLQTVPD